MREIHYNTQDVLVNTRTAFRNVSSLLTCVDHEQMTGIC